MTLIIEVTSTNFEKGIEIAVNFLREGRLIIYPTETCYGLGGDALSESVVKKVFEAKGREFNKPIHVLVSDFKMAKEIAYFNRLADELTKRFWPGPLTIVLPVKPTVPRILTAGLNKIGLRVSSNQLATEIVKSFGKPITATSANLSGYPEPYTVTEALKYLTGRADLALDYGKLPKVKPSTIVDLSEEEIKILREGPISREEIYSIFKNRFT